MAGSGEFEAACDSEALWRPVVLWSSGLISLNDLASLALMEPVPVTDMKNRLSHYLRLVRAGARLTIVDRGRPIAVLAPITGVDDDIGELVAAGVAAPAEARLSKGFLTKPLPKSRRSVTAALIEGRDDRF